MLIYAVKIRKRSRHDTRDLQALFNKTKSIEFKRFYADKAYDAEWFHELIFDSGGESRIHLKQEDVPVHRTHGRWRKHMKRRHKNSQKGKRSLCETINSSIKRIFGYVFSEKYPGTVPLYRYFNGKDHFYTQSANTPAGYECETILGYVYPSKRYAIVQDPN